TNGPDKRGGVRMAAVYRAYGHLLGDARVRAYLVCGGLIYAAMFAYITSAPFVYIQIFNVDPQYFGFYFGLNVVGMLIGNYLNGRLVTRLGYRRMLGLGAGVALVSTLALLGFALAGFGGLAAIVAMLFFAVGTVGIVGANTVAGLLDLYPRNAGAASALFGVFQYGLGAAAGAVVGALYSGTPVAMAVVMAAAAAGAFAAYKRLASLATY
ncbi:MAG TPA: MFS transporter, partial [Gammaproteobacteria bacterium]|nr:MFS transporter [Gammaproteobacteria bacterium]